MLRLELFDDGGLADLVLSAFVRGREVFEANPGAGVEIIGTRSSEAVVGCSTSRGGGNSAAQAAIGLARGGVLVALPRRDDLSGAMPSYLIHDLAVRRRGAGTKRDNRSTRRGR